MRGLPGYRGAQVLLDLVRGADQRHAALLRLRRPAGLFQPFGTTFNDRYPETFAELRERLGGMEGVRLLSFGCATGEEVASLRACFPKAFIKGIDISPERIAICHAQRPVEHEAQTQFEVGDSARDEGDAVYDAVLAMAVFRHGLLNDFTIQHNRILDFERFEREVTELARTVRPGGYLALRHSNFRFADTVVAAGFEPVGYTKCITPLFNRSGARLPDQALEASLFRKH